MYKKLLSFTLSALLVLSLSTTAFAAEYNQTDNYMESTSVLTMDFNDFSSDKQIEMKKDIIDENGQKATVGLIFTPNKETDTKLTTLKWSKSHDATEGTWTSYYDGVTNHMSYDFDISRSGSHWKISNARNLKITALLYDITNRDLSINRSTSSSTQKAEVYGSCTLLLIDTPIGHVATIDAWIKTVISDSGTLTVSGN